ncbi:hypothetical protein MOJ79_16920 [Calidifontimicrobium sp. SYSU G02091]|uniref:hypothetical protein n=1 Tax=Calidifontimicrobium sp. SYSU G02091 TaxID=2926421 RepID=UPI001F52FC56|nr:hypothetical protein [Calidifontimicrobium sp. SYSU G02091]MCI1193516.1 hypothetical protein [Calidifontimicrobium sp. SYSU G02091]
MHHTLRISSPWEHQQAVEVDGFVPQATSHPELHARAALTLRAGAFELLLRPTAEELRAVAQLATTLADALKRQA